MSIFRNHYVGVLNITEGSIGRISFQFRTLSTGNLIHLTYTERDIVNMRNLIIRHKKGIIAEDDEDEARIKAENLSAVLLQIQLIPDKIVLDQMNTC